MVEKAELYGFAALTGNTHEFDFDFADKANTLSIGSISFTQDNFFNGSTVIDSSKQMRYFPEYNGKYLNSSGAETSNASKAYHTTPI